MESLVVVVLGIHVLHEDLKKNPYLNISNSTMPKKVRSKKHNLYKRIINRRGEKFTELNESFLLNISDRSIEHVFFEVKIGQIFQKDTVIGKGKTV